MCYSNVSKYLSVLVLVGILATPVSTLAGTGVMCPAGSDLVENNLLEGCAPHGWNTTIIDALQYNDDYSVENYQTLFDVHNDSDTNARLLIQYQALNPDDTTDMNLKDVLKQYQFTADHTIPDTVEIRRAKHLFGDVRLAKQLDRNDSGGVVVDTVYYWFLNRDLNTHVITGFYQVTLQGEHGSDNFKALKRDLKTFVELAGL